MSNTKPAVVITAQELKALAAMAQITIADEELAAVEKDIQAVLSYVACLQDVPLTKVAEAVLPTTTFGIRPDEPRAYDGQSLVAASVQHVNNFFVVPTIVKTSKS